MAIGIDGFGIEEAVDSFSVHEVCAYEACECERAFDGLLIVLCAVEQEIGDEGDGDLDSDGVFGGSEEVLDPEGLLDPSEEQLDGPSFERMRRIFPVWILRRISRTGSWKGFLRLLAWR